jgi:exopolyphosphatase/guanosine-5'-triphosphate,3'-diphosphate pyrophosphatase
MVAVERFGERCGYDAQHAMKVRDIALSLFDQLTEEFPLDRDDRSLLEAAALLHDVGYHISYEKHHKHSHHLIAYSDLQGFTGRERRIIAAVARYHRGALPKTRHQALQDMEKADRKLVGLLGGILKLADGLDRTRSGRIEEVTDTSVAGSVIVQLVGRGNLDVEIHGAVRKADLFERAFDTRLDIIAEQTGRLPL